MQLDSDLEHAIEAYNEANSRLEQTEQRIDENTTRLADHPEQPPVAQEELNQALVNAYMHGETDIVQVMLSAESLSAVLDEVSLLNRATSHSADVLSRIRQYKVEVKERQADLEKEQAARKQAVADRRRGARPSSRGSRRGRPGWAR